MAKMFLLDINEEMIDDIKYIIDNSGWDYWDTDEGEMWHKMISDLREQLETTFIVEVDVEGGCVVQITKPEADNLKVVVYDYDNTENRWEDEGGTTTT